MIETRLVNEVKNLIKKYGPKQQSFDAIGYREIIDYFGKKILFENAVELMKRNTRNYAKRQMTWFKKDIRTNWISDQNQAEKLIKKFLFQ